MDNKARDSATYDNSIAGLVEKAIAAREMAYVPYSGFKVGAALLASDGSVVVGCNVENAAFSPGSCAERTAFNAAVAQGFREFKAIAVVGGAGDELAENCFPCGVCRQVMAEFCTDEFKIIIAQSPSNWEVYTLPEILPYRFGPANLS
jgi:cytidine deaminase